MKLEFKSVNKYCEKKQPFITNCAANLAAEWRLI